MSVRLLRFCRHRVYTNAATECTPPCRSIYCICHCVGGAAAAVAVAAGTRRQAQAADTARVAVAAGYDDAVRRGRPEPAGRTGKPRIEALRAMALRTRTAEVSLWVDAIAQAESMGMSLGPLLRSQSDQRRQERFHRAEKRALEAPVKMLLPLIFCIFPCTFIVLAFPIAMKILHSGV